MKFTKGANANMTGFKGEFPITFQVSFMEYPGRVINLSV